MSAEDSGVFEQETTVGRGTLRGIEGFYLLNHLSPIDEDLYAAGTLREYYSYYGGKI